MNPHRFKKYKWLNLKKLANCYLMPTRETLSGVYYFTALAFWDDQKVARHEAYIKAQEAEGVNVVKGYYKRKDKFCNRCRRDFRTYEEKQTDVNIALYLFTLAATDAYDKAIVVTGDSDIIPSIVKVKETYPSKEIGVVIPIERYAEDIKKNSHFSFQMREHHLQSSLFPLSYTHPDGTVLTCPATWR